MTLANISWRGHELRPFLRAANCAPIAETAMKLITRHPTTNGQQPGDDGSSIERQVDKSRKQHPSMLPPGQWVVGENPHILDHFWPFLPLNGLNDSFKPAWHSAGISKEKDA